jgi:ligand-binding SRPBCC domain-containing protein
MTVYRLDTDLWLPAPLDEVFPFFADAFNLERLTPPWLRFRVLTPAPIRMAAGARIDYRLAVRGVPLRWQSEITVWDPPRRFVDEQRRGPYRYWSHQHLFEARDGGTRVTDEVRFASWGGAPVVRLLVAPDVRRIFAWRHERLRERFGGNGDAKGGAIVVRRA